MNEERIGAFEAARRLGISSKTISRYCERGVLKAERHWVGALGCYRWRISVDSIEDLRRRAEESRN